VFVHAQVGSLLSFWLVVDPFPKKGKKTKTKRKEEEVDHSFFNFRLKSAFVSLHHWLSPAARKPFVSSGSVRQSSPQASVFYFQTKLPELFTLSLRADDRIYSKYIMNIILLIYIS